ncbi:hypothetical protein BB560_000005 [Smittium megazygosporum]|uniref:Uncharacterized protein n=1 Tax=Smittium megazygosporum TaxID=133381 RepID=A0A2T9ZLK2_9FUNG|nr:hypothetical protein BB560_000005 [Smittium megazygosporum]
MNLYSKHPMSPRLIYLIKKRSFFSSSPSLISNSKLPLQKSNESKDLENQVQDTSPNFGNENEANSSALKSQGQINMNDNEKSAQSSHVTEQDSQYVRNLVRKHDYNLYLTSLFSPQNSRDPLYSIWALNFELAKIMSSSSPEIALLKLSWWSSTISQLYNGTCVHTPTGRILFNSIQKYKISKMWLTRNIRGRLLQRKGFRDASDLEKYGEMTIASNIHAHLEILGVRNVNADNAARMIGQSAAIADLVQKILMAANKNIIQIPQSLVLKYNLDVKEILENKSSKALQDAVFDLATPGFTKLCGISEIFIPNSPKSAIPAFLYAVSSPVKLVQTLGKSKL